MSNSPVLEAVLNGIPCCVRGLHSPRLGIAGAEQPGEVAKVIWLSIWGCRLVRFYLGQTVGRTASG